MSKKINDVEYSSLRKPDKDRFPRIVIIIVVAEFCERFSYSGMRAFLTLYMRSKLDFSDDGATEVYHIFSTLAYVFPFFGGILSDNYFGKYKTILYMMFVYAAGNILVALTAIPQLALPGRLCTMLGLFMITIGTGGIKPCVTAFGGDQFELPEQKNHLKVYFSVLYFSLCTGSLIAKTISPILRSEVHCFGEKDCYSLAFGAPGLIIIIAIVIFVSAKRWYKIKEPKGNVIFDFVKCISLGMKNATRNRRCLQRHAHWLDSTSDQFDDEFINDVKKTLSILKMFIVIPVFWSLLDQMGSRWTLQATQMDGWFWFVTVKPDQIQVIGPIFILLLIPLFQKYLYPFLERHNLLKSPLDKLKLGGVLAGIAFIIAGLLQLHINMTNPQLPQNGYSQLRIFNGLNCPLSIDNTNESISYNIPALDRYVNRNLAVESSRNITLTFTGDCVGESDIEILLEENAAMSYYFFDESIIFFEDDVGKSKSGFPVLRFLIPSYLKNITYLINKNTNELERTIDGGDWDLVPVYASIYALKINDTIVQDNIKIESGGVYAIIANQDLNNTYNSNVLVISKPNTVWMIYILPQFLIMSIAEVLFAVTGNEFAFKESPQSMKAMMSAVWLLTESAGNIIIILITRLCANYDQATQFFIYTGMMFAAMIIFHFMARGYKYRSDDEENIPMTQAKEETKALKADL